MNKRAGFSLIELMIVVVIIAIAAGIAIPNMSGWFGNKDLDSISLQMFSDFQRARSEAITRGRTVTIQIHTGNGSWYEIHDSTNSQIVPQTTMPGGITITNTTFPLSSTVNTSGISSRGFATQQGTVTIHSTSASSANSNRTITLWAGGAVSIAP